MRFIIIFILLVLGSCSTPFKKGVLIGTYKSSNRLDNSTSLKINSPNNYTFCRSKCETNRFSVWKKASSRIYVIRFEGAEIERYSREILSDGVGSQEVSRALGPPAGQLDADIEFSGGMVKILVDGVSETYLEKK